MHVELERLMMTLAQERSERFVEWLLHDITALFKNMIQLLLPITSPWI